MWESLRDVTAELWAFSLKILILQTHLQQETGISCAEQMSSGSAGRPSGAAGRIWHTGVLIWTFLLFWHHTSMGKYGLMMLFSWDHSFTCLTRTAWTDLGDGALLWLRWTEDRGFRWFGLRLKAKCLVLISSLIFCIVLRGWLTFSPLRIQGASQKGGAVQLRETILQYANKQAS